MKLGEKKWLREEQGDVKVGLAQPSCGTPHEVRGCLQGRSKWFKVKGGAGMKHPSGHSVHTNVVQGALTSSLIKLWRVLQNALCKSCRANTCSFYYVFSIYQLTAPVDSSMDVNRRKEGVVSLKAAIIPVFLLLGQALPMKLLQTSRNTPNPCVHLTSELVLKHGEFVDESRCNRDQKIWEAWLVLCL